MYGIRVLLLCVLSICIVGVHSSYQGEERGTIHGLKFKHRSPDRFQEKALQFNDKRGTLALLSRDRRTAIRDREDVSFALVYTIRALNENEPFEIRVAELVATGIGNKLAFGVTDFDPSNYEETPDYYTELKGLTWILSGQSLQHFNGSNWITTNESYSPGITMTGDSLAVMKNSDGDIHFFFNGIDLGVAATGIQNELFGVVDILGDAKKIEID